MEIKLIGRTWKGEIINRMIFGELFKPSHPIIESIPQVVRITQDGKFQCLLCGRWFKNYRGIFYHIPIHHKDVYWEIIAQIQAKLGVRII